MEPFRLRPFRFGVLNYPNCTALAAQARRAEELGYDVFHLSDHFMNIAPVAAMTAVAMGTTKIRIGSAVFGNDFWYPAILARELLAIDCLSNGRLQFGLGSGWYSEDYKQSGIPMESPGARISRLEESVPIYKGLLSGETVTFQGKYYHVNGLDLVAKPTQLPHPPIMIGGAASGCSAWQGVKPILSASIPAPPLAEGSIRFPYRRRPTPRKLNGSEKRPGSVWRILS